MKRIQATEKNVSEYKAIINSLTDLELAVWAQLLRERVAIAIDGDTQLRGLTASGNGDEDLAQARVEYKKVLRSLYKKGLIDCERNGTTAKLTPKKLFDLINRHHDILRNELRSR